MLDPDQLQQQIEQLQNDLIAAQERQAEFEQWTIAQLEQQQSHANRLRTILTALREYQAVAIGLVGLAIALWGASPEVRADTAKTWVNGISAASLGALCIAIQRKKADQEPDELHPPKSP
jgi:type II secretory pathway pseudopilin PulG